jgi:uncharacterized protein YegL
VLRKMADAFQQAYCSPQDAGPQPLAPADTKLKNIYLFDTEDPTAGQYHYVFCLDASGSMGGGSGSPWQQCVDAYNSFLNQRIKDQGLDDLVTVIVFSCSAQVQVQRSTVESAPRNLRYTDGGTSFCPALSLADQQMRACRAIPVLLFMSDGEAGDNSAARRQLESMRRSHDGLQINAVFFGSGGGQLQDMVSGLGKYYNATTRVELRDVFVQVSMTCSLGDELEKAFGQSIGDEIANKIVIDHL